MCALWHIIPNSNGRDERLHRTIREEVPIDSDDDLYQVQNLVAEFRDYYKNHRPPTALKYLRPVRRSSFAATAPPSSPRDTGARDHTEV